MGKIIHDEHAVYSQLSLNDAIDSIAVEGLETETLVADYRGNSLDVDRNELIDRVAPVYTPIIEMVWDKLRKEYAHVDKSQLYDFAKNAISDALKEYTPKVGYSFFNLSLVYFKLSLRHHIEMLKIEKLEAEHNPGAILD